MTGIVNSTGAKSGIIGTTVGTPAGGLDGVTTGSGNVTITNGNLVIGTSGKGIDFSATADTSTTGASMTSELLDDSEIGTWTPILRGYSPATVITFSAGTQVFKYVKVGRLVTVSFSISGSASSSAPTPDAESVISGFPFTSSVNSFASTPLIYHEDGTRLDRQSVAVLGANSTLGYFMGFAVSGYTFASFTNSGTTYFSFTLHYFTD